MCKYDECFEFWDMLNMYSEEKHLLILAFVTLPLSMPWDHRGNREHVAILLNCFHTRWHSVVHHLSQHTA